MPTDPFGLRREQAINSSGVRDVFSPHRPINRVELFFGREKEVGAIIEQINTPGQHSLLYGDRGVGKSSLANIASELLLGQVIKGELYSYRCDSHSTFESILARPLAEVGVDMSISSETKSSKSGGSAKLKVPIAEGGFGTESTNTEERVSLRGNLTPSVAADYLKSLPGLLVIDEADVIKKKVDKRHLAEFIKLLSDHDSALKVLVVGVAETGSILVDNHESVGRCLRETKLRRMPEVELSKIVTGGANQVNLKFAGPVVRSIAKVSAGYPHFTHLLALKCAEDAVAESRKIINSEHLNLAIQKSIEDAEGSLTRTYSKAIRSYNTDMYRVVLCAAASLPKEEFTSKELRDEIKSQTGEEYSQGTIANYLKRLVSEGTGTILRREAKGVYRFNDPRMPSYIKIANSMLPAA